MIRLTACVSGRVQRVGYRAKVVSPANEMDLVGIVQNRPDGSLLVIAEGEEKDKLERFASAIAIKNALIHADNVDAQYAQGSGQYSARYVVGMLIDIKSLRSASTTLLLSLRMASKTLIPSPMMDSGTWAARWTRRQTGRKRPIEKGLI